MTPRRTGRSLVTLLSLVTLVVLASASSCPGCNINDIAGPSSATVTLKILVIWGTWQGVSVTGGNGGNNVRISTTRSSQDGELVIPNVSKGSVISFSASGTNFFADVFSASGSCVYNGVSFFTERTIIVHAPSSPPAAGDGPTITCKGWQ